MRARKIVIMLAVFAISTLTLFVITLFDGEALGAEAPTLELVGAMPDTMDYYRESVSIGPDGNALVELTVVPASGGPGDLLLPFAFADGRDFAILSGPVQFKADGNGLAIPTRLILGYRMLNLERLEFAAAGDTVRVSALVPNWFDQQESKKEYGEFGLVRSFVNSSAFVLRVFALAVELPDEMLVHSVTKVAPAYDPKKSPEPPFSVGHNENRGWAVLHHQNLIPAGTVRMEMNIRPARRGRLPLIAGLIAAILYLVFFRDVLKPKETE